MKIAIASEGPTENDMVSPITGRAPYFLIFEGEKLIKSVKNPFAFGGGGAGFGVAQMLSNEGVEVLVSGRVGPNVQAFLESKGIKMVSMSNITVKEALKRVLNA